jgi:hypothetical protein
VGLVPIAIAINWVPVDPATLHAPRWVLFLCGLAFVAGGALLLAAQGPRLRDFCALVLLVCLGTVAAWSALGSPSHAISGGVPFLPHPVNVTLARGLFGVGALVSFALSISVMRRFFDPNS